MSTTVARRVVGYLALVVVAASMGCDEGAGADAGGGGGAAGALEPPPDDGLCVPDEQAWQSTIRPVIEQHCNSCHGDTPQFGAPYALTDYASLLDGALGERPVDRIAIRVGEGTMPPLAQPQPGGEDRAAIVDWATCGAGGDPGDGPNPGGFDVDRPVLAAPEEPPAGTDFFELRADGFEVDADTADRIECFTFAAPIDAPRMIRRIETIVDDGRVLHHATLIPDGDVRPAGTHSECDGDMGLNVLYAWAPGQGPLHFDEGGIILEPGQILTVQIHYNNAARHADVRDRSGVRIHHGPVEGPVIDQVTIGPFDFELPPRAMHEVTGYCLVPQETTLIASFPHMHEYGAAFRQTIVRADGTVEPLITLNGWSFDDQYIYETPLTLYPGDVIETTCRFQNPEDFTVSAGTRTQDEMCFNFAYVTPPVPARYCDLDGGGGGGQAAYMPSACAPDGASAQGIGEIEADFVEGEPAAATGGEIAPGRYVVTGAVGWFDALDLGFGALDLPQSEIEVSGQLWIGDEQVAVDLLLELELVGEAGGLEDLVQLGASGPRIAADPTQLAFEAQCSTEDDFDVSTLGYDAMPDGRLRVYAALVEGVVLEIVLDPADE